MIRKLRVISAMILGACLAVALLLGGGQLLASTLSSHNVPPIVNYQGYLTEANGDPVSGTVTLSFSIWDASSAGNQVWNETHNSVAVNSGYFSVFLGSQGTPLTPSVFSSPSRYLELVYDSTTFARQRFASVPYALVAQQASEAITSTYATTATYALNAPSSSGGVEWEHVVVVAKSGGDYTTVTDAMNAISPSSLQRYLVLVMPGLYEEQVTLKEYVHLKGAGENMTFISYSATTNNPNDDGAAVMLVPGYAQVSDLTIRNTSNVNAGTGVKVDNGNTETILSHLRIENTGGGTNRRGVYVSGGLDSPKFSYVYVNVSGGTGQNWGFFSSASIPTIEHSTIKATGANAGVQTYGVRYAGGAGTVDDTDVVVTNTSTAQGINTSDGTNEGTVYVNNSNILSDSGPTGDAILSNTDHKFRVTHTQLRGDILVTDGQVGTTDDIFCVGAYTDAYVELNNTCQP